MTADKVGSNNIIHATTERLGGPPSGAQGPRLLWWSAGHPPNDPTVSFQSRTVLITGANTGLGFEAALKYATLGAAKLILAVRSIDKGHAAKEMIVQRTGFSADAISVLKVDLGSFASVKYFVTDLNDTVEYIDVALLNAGLAAPNFSRSGYGWEMSVQVNVLSTALMALLLLPKLRATAAARGSLVHLTFVNSITHVDVRREWFPDQTLLTAANDESRFDLEKTYAMTKLLGMAAMQGVADAAA